MMDALTRRTLNTLTTGALVALLLVLPFACTNKAHAQSTVKGSALPVASSVQLTDRAFMLIDPGGTAVTKTATLQVISNLIGGGASTFAALTDVNLTSPASGDFLKWNGADWINRTAANVRTDLGLVIGTNVQAYNAILAALAALSNGSGVLTNNGAGSLSWATPSGTISGLTATRVPFASSATALTDSANLTFATDTLSGTALKINVTGTTAATSSTTGALIVGGGVGIGTDSWIHEHRIGQGAFGNSSNICFGANALFSNVSGTDNTGIGPRSLVSLTAGSRNTGVGNWSLDAVQGSDNTAIGFEAGAKRDAGAGFLTTADNSTFIGSKTEANSNGQTNQIVIGANSFGEGSNTTVIGNASTTAAHIFGALTADSFIGDVTGSADTLTTGRTLAITGDLTWTSPSFNGSTNVTAAGTLATVNSNVGSFTNASVTVNAKGLVTAASSGTAPVTSITGTTNEITVTGTTTPTLSLPSALTFTGKTITGGTFNSGAFNGTVGATTPTTGAFTNASTRGFIQILQASGAQNAVIIGGDDSAYPGIHIGYNHYLGWSGGDGSVSVNLVLYRTAAATLGIGSPLASAWVNQTIGPSGAIVGVGTNISPSNNLTITNSVSTGTGSSTGKIYFSTYGTNGSSGTAIGTLTERMNVSSSGVTIGGNRSGASTFKTVATVVKAAYNPASIASDGTETTTATITSCAAGSTYVATPSYFGGLQISAARTGADTVTITFFNPTAGAIDAAAVDVRVTEIEF